MIIVQEIKSRNQLKFKHEQNSKKDRSNGPYQASASSSTSVQHKNSRATQAYASYSDRSYNLISPPKFIKSSANQS